MAGRPATGSAARHGRPIEEAAAVFLPRLDPRADGAGLPAPPEAGPRRHSVAFSTHGLPHRQQFEAWHDSSAGTVDTTPLSDPEAGFPARREAWTLGPMALTAMQAPAARLSRSAAQARRGGLDHWMVNIALRGERRVAMGDVRLALPAGVASVSALDDVFVSDRSEIEWVCLFVPRPAVEEIGPALHASRDRPLDTGMGRVLAAYLAQLAAEMPTLAEAEVPRVVEATRAILAASIAPSAEAMARARAPIEQVQVTRVRSLIRQQLRSAMLRPERLCRLAGVSRSQLYRLFEPLGGVARYIQAERLRAACRALADPMDARDIAAIAEDVGFFDHSSFSRVFRRDYGCSPRDFRVAALAGQAVATTRGASAPRPASHAELLRRL